MTDDEARAWVAALRSGEYKQGKGQLKTPEGNFCCLGVANEVMALGLPDHYGALQDKNTHAFTKLPRALQTTFYGLNDSRSLTFAEIAAYIEEGFNLV
jgi:hypothetical protein